MTQPIAEIPRPRAEGYRAGRKIYLVPALLVRPGAPEELGDLLVSYWGDVRDQVGRLESSLTRVTHVYHESVFASGNEGLTEIEGLNVHGCGFIRALSGSGAAVEATEDREAASESSDWSMCLSMGLSSEKVTRVARESLAEAVQRRYEHIAEVIDRTLGEQEAGLCVLSEDHRVQFPSDVQVFYVSPPSLNDVKRWMDDWVRRAMEQAGEQAPVSEEAPEPGGHSDSADGDGKSGTEDSRDEQGDDEAERRGEHPEYPY